MTQHGSLITYFEHFHRLILHFLIDELHFLGSMGKYEAHSDGVLHKRLSEKSLTVISNAYYHEVTQFANKCHA